jgi:hypothetical protein
MNSVLNVVESTLKVLILWWVVVYDKYKTARVSDPRQGRRKSTRAIRLLGSDTRAVFLLNHVIVFGILVLFTLRDKPSLLETAS